MRRRARAAHREAARRPMTARRSLRSTSTQAPASTSAEAAKSSRPAASRPRGSGQRRVRACACGQRQHEPPLGTLSFRTVSAWLGIHVASVSCVPGLAAARREFLRRRPCSAARAPMAIAPHGMRRPQPARSPHVAASPHRTGGRGLAGLGFCLARATDASAGGRAGALHPLLLQATRFTLSRRRDQLRDVGAAELDDLASRPRTTR